jgi:4'-phosphopantetheinyl transferase
MGPIEHRQSPIEHREVRLHRVRWDAARASGRRAFLSDEERARLDGYGVEKRRREFLLGRVAARQLLSDVLGAAPAEVPLAVAEDGAVEVGGEGAWRVSISHTGEEAVAAVAEQPVGVDLERIRKRPERLHRFLLAEEERSLLKRLPRPTTGEAFTLCWALKEAVLKAQRCGLRRSPKTLRIAALNAEAGTARLVARERGRTFAAAFERDGALWLTVAWETDDGN